jgi:hypothetical protein
VFDFSIYGILMRISLENEDAVHLRIFETATLEFDYFKSEMNPALEPRISIRVGALRRPTLNTSMTLKAGIGLIGWHRDHRSVQCALGSRLEFFPHSKKSEINFFGTDAIEASVLTNAIEAVLGECLEKAGYLRLHAAACQEFESVVVISAPSGGGKSTTIARQLLNPTSRVYSDEMTWIKENVVYPFPTPIALHAKNDGCASMIEVMKAWTGLTRTFVGSEKRLLTVHRDSVAKPANLLKIVAIESGWFRTLKWTARIVSGQGLPQMWPYLIRAENVLWLIRLALKRLSFALRMLAHRKVEFQTKTEFQANENNLRQRC